MITGDDIELVRDGIELAMHMGMCAGVIAGMWIGLIVPSIAGFIEDQIEWWKDRKGRAALGGCASGRRRRP